MANLPLLLVCEVPLSNFYVLVKGKSSLRAVFWSDTKKSISTLLGWLLGGLQPTSAFKNRSIHPEHPFSFEIRFVLSGSGPGGLENVN